MLVHLARLMKEGVIEERAYELALKQFFDNTPGGVSNASPPELNSVGKASSHRPMTTPRCVGFVHKGVGMKGNSPPIPSSFVPSSTPPHKLDKGKEPMNHNTSMDEHDKGSPMPQGDFEYEHDLEWGDLDDFGHLQHHGGEQDFTTPSLVDPVGDGDALSMGVDSRASVTWELHSSTFDTRKEAMTYIKGLPNKYKQLYHYKREYTVYGCLSHLACPSKIRIRKMSDPQNFCVQFSEDDHSTTLTDYPRPRGLPQVLRAEVDRRILATDTPMKIYCDLNRHDDFKAHIASLDRHKFLTCVRNRKKHLTRLQGGPIFMDTTADLMNWARSHIFPESVKDFLACQESELNVLPRGYRSDVRAVVFSSLKLTLNILKAHFDRPYNFTLMMDGTHKLHFGKWLLVTCGVISLRWSRSNSGLSQTFKPVAYCFCESENDRATTLLLESVKDLCVRLVFSLTGSV
jgi:hypothetical protein